VGVTEREKNRGDPEAGIIEVPATRQKGSNKTGGVGLGHIKFLVVRKEIKRNAND